MAGMLDVDNYNKENRENKLDLIFEAMGPTNEKSAFLLALMIMQQPDPVSYNNFLIATIDSFYNQGGNGNSSAGSTHAELSNMRQKAWSIYLKIK